MGIHNFVRVVFMVYFVHRKSISVLHSPIAKRKAYDLAELHCVDRENNLGYHNRAELMKPACILRLGLERDQTVHDTQA